MLVLLTNILQHSTETLLTCARPQVYSTATHGFPELDVMAAGANGKPVSKAEVSKRTTPAHKAETDTMSDTISPKRWSKARAWRMRDAPIMEHIAADRAAQYIPMVTNGGQMFIFWRNP